MNVADILDRAVWSHIHLRIVVALGIAWILDGFESTVTAPVLANVAKDLHFGGATASWVNPIYTMGMLAGALFFGPLADRLGRRRLFLITLAIYGVATVLTGFAWDFWSLALFRFITGVGIGGEYGAINSAIEEFIPPGYRGRVDGLINASWNIGAILASSAAFFALSHLPIGAWRTVFWFGAVVAVGVLFVRNTVPESPRWLLARGRAAEARAIVVKLFGAQEGVPAADESLVPDVPANPSGYLEQIRRLWSETPMRVLFSFALNLAQVMPYYGILAIGGIAIFPAVGITGTAIPLLYLASAGSSLLGQVMMAFLCDSWGRRPTLITAFTGAGVLCIALSLARTTPAFVAAFLVFGMFSASCGAGAYVVLSEIFATDVRSTGIGLSVAVGRVGAIIAPPLFFFLYQKMGVGAVFAAMSVIFFFGAATMLWWLRYGVEGRGRSLEEMLATGIR